MTRKTHTKELKFKVALEAIQGDLTIAQLVMVIDTQRLEEMLTRLKLTAVRDQLDNLLEEIARQEMNLREALSYLCQEEIAHKDERPIRMGTSIAKFPFYRSLDDFEFDAQPSLDPKLVRELGTCRWVGNGDTVLLLGPPGVGKTHLAVGLGRGAISSGYSVLFTTAMTLLTHLASSHQKGELEERLTHYGKPKLLIISLSPLFPTHFTPLRERKHLVNKQPSGKRMGRGLW